MWHPTDTTSHPLQKEDIFSSDAAALDSGFLSGSNLLSSSSVCPDEPPTSRCSSSAGGPAPDTMLMSAGGLDSGIDISEQMSGLQLQQQNTLDTPTPAEEPVQLSKGHASILTDIFSPDEDGDTKLHHAVMSGFVEVVHQVTRILPHQAFLDLTNNNGSTVLHLAVNSGVHALVRHLVVCGASPVARDLRGNTPLHVACVYAQPEMVAELTRPVTMSEVAQAHLSYIPKHTLGRLAADLTNFQGETCVHVATASGNRQILSTLAALGADINAKECLGGRTALHIAVDQRDPDLVSHLVLNCGATLTLENYSRLSPYQQAIANGAGDIATHLLDLGAPAQVLPSAFTDDDSSSSSDSDDQLEETFESAPINSWQEVDDLRLGGIPMGLPVNPPAVSTAHHTINADLFY